MTSDTACRWLNRTGDDSDDSDESDDSGDDGGPIEMSVYDISNMEIIVDYGDNPSDVNAWNWLEAGVYALNIVDNQAFIAEANDDGSYSLSTGTPIALARQYPSVETMVSNDTVLGNVTLEQDQAEPNIVFETYWEDGGGFKIEGNNVFLKDGFYLNLDYGSGGPHLVDASTGGGYLLGDGDNPFELSIKVSGDVTIGYTGIDVIDGNEKYFTHESAEIAAGGGYNFTAMDFNGFEFGAVLGMVSAGFDYDSIAFTYDESILELAGNTIKLKDTVYYDVSQQTFNLPSGSFFTLGGLSGATVTATEDSFNVFTDAVAFSDMITGGQVMPAPYWAGVPAGTKALPTETNIKALMFGDSDGNTTYFITDPSQDDSAVGDDIIITYSFVEDSSSKFVEGAGSSGGPNQSTVWAMNEAQQASVRESLDTWSDVADITFVEIIESQNSDVVGTMRFGFTTYKGDAENVAGWASPPGGGYGNGDVWIASTDDEAGVAQRAKDDEFQKGSSQGFLTLLHEIGHALGLAHPFEDFLMEGADPDTGEGAPLDDNKYTVMSYSQDQNSGTFINGEYVFTISSTPMLVDIAAIQFLYGAQETTNLGDTTYTFEDDFPFAEAIWDAGGDDDLLNFSNFTTDLTVSLVPGSSSTIPTTIPNGIWEMTDNLGIADGALIENIKAGSGDDTIVGNNEGNVIVGGTGADTITTSDGADTVVLRAGDGGGTVADADKITDFANGTDMLGLDDGLLYTDLTIAQGTGGNSSDTIISAGAEYLAILKGFDVADLAQDDFIAVDIA